MPSKSDIMMARWILSYMVDILEKTQQYDGILLCEGNHESIDIKLYQRIYSNLLVIPVGGWTQVKNILSMIRRGLKKIGYTAYGIIDRDSLSKAEMRRFKKMGIYCTKLPFIENIISCPEVLSVLCDNCEYDFDKKISTIQANLIRVLYSKLRASLPINIPIKEDESIDSITIRIKKSDGRTVEKMVDRTNIVYAYRDKAVANEIAESLDIVGRRNYYEFFKKCLEDPALEEKILKCVTHYLPVIQEEL